MGLWLVLKMTRFWLLLQYQRTPLHLAAISGKELVARLLIEKGAQVIAKERVSRGKSGFGLGDDNLIFLVVAQDTSSRGKCSGKRTNGHNID